MEPLLYFYESISHHCMNEAFILHMHDNYEILLFLKGDSKYFIEENIYDLKPYDIIVIRKNQMHRIYHNSDTAYHRIVLNISPDFFCVNKCTEYEEQFISPSSEIGNKIDAATVISSGLYDAFMRMREYSNNFTETDSPIFRAGVIEILYLMSNIKLYSNSETENTQLKEVISHINKNYTQNLTLDELEKRFFISKYHLCHIFPQATGMTVHQYITKKRLALAKDMIKSGMSIKEASNQSGFNNYSSFYRAYLKEYGISPKLKA